MIMNTQLSNVDTNIEDEEVMGMEMNAQLYSVLSDKMYTNPIQSIIREMQIPLQVFRSLFRYTLQTRLNLSFTSRTLVSV